MNAHDPGNYRTPSPTVEIDDTALVLQISYDNVDNKRLLNKVFADVTNAANCQLKDELVDEIAVWERPLLQKRPNRPTLKDTNTLLLRCATLLKDQPSAIYEVTQLANALTGIEANAFLKLKRLQTVSSMSPGGVS